MIGTYYVLWVLLHPYMQYDWHVKSVHPYAPITPIYIYYVNYQKYHNNCIVLLLTIDIEPRHLYIGLSIFPSLLSIYGVCVCNCMYIFYCGRVRSRQNVGTIIDRLPDLFSLSRLLYNLIILLTIIVGCVFCWVSIVMGM